jgi:hypothetical protein
LTSAIDWLKIIESPYSGLQVFEDPSGWIMATFFVLSAFLLSGPFNSGVKTRESQKKG